MLSLNQAVKLTFASLDRRLGPGGPGIDVGLKVFGKGGLHAGDLHVIAGAPGSGKTGLAVRVATVAAKAGAQVLYVTASESAVELGERALVFASEVERGRLLDGQLSRHDMTQLTYGAADACKLDFQIEDRGDLDLDALIATATEWRKPGVLHGVVVIDPIDLVEMSPDARTARRLVMLARLMKGTVVCVANVAARASPDPCHPLSWSDMFEMRALVAAAASVVNVHPVTGDLEDRHVLVAAKQRRASAVLEKVELVPLRRTISEALEAVVGPEHDIDTTARVP